MPRPLFIAATRQHVGKTTVSLAIMAGLQKRFPKRVGFMKPVGQQHVTVAQEGRDIRVDKDVQLMREYFDIKHIEYGDMSPVIVPRDYTKQFIDGDITGHQQEELIRLSMERQASTSDMVLMEGTGHVGVGSVIEMSNARVAGLTGADVVMVVNGGIGSAFDELEVNHCLLQQHGVQIRGVVVNKVRPDKMEMIRDYFGRAIREKWGLPLLGVVPDLPFLANSTLADLEHLCGGELLAGHHCRRLHYGAGDLNVVTTGLRRFLRKMQYSQQTKRMFRPLFITHCTRDDIVLGYLAHFQKNKHAGDIRRAAFGRGAKVSDSWQGAMILCKGNSEGVFEEDNSTLPYLTELVKAYDAPIMIAKTGTAAMTEQITAHTSKLNISDRSRVAAAIQHYEPHIDFDLLLDETRRS